MDDILVALFNSAEFSKFLTAVAALIAAIGGVLAALGAVAGYLIALYAERRTRRTAAIDNEIKAHNQLSALMERAEARGPVTFVGPTPISAPVGLASQLAAISSIVRLALVHDSLIDPAISGLHGLDLITVPAVRNALDDAIARLEGQSSANRNKGGVLEF